MTKLHRRFASFAPCCAVCCAVLRGPLRGFVYSAVSVLRGVENRLVFKTVNDCLRLFIYENGLCVGGGIHMCLLIHVLHVYRYCII